MPLQPSLPPSLIGKIVARALRKHHKQRIAQVQSSMSFQRRRKKRAPNRKRDREYGVKHMDQLSNREFRRSFRMTRVSFNKLLDLIKDQISSDEKQAKNSSGSAISAATKLGATIRFLAGGSYIDIAGLYGLDPNNFFNSVSGPL